MKIITRRKESLILRQITLHQLSATRARLARMHPELFQNIEDLVRDKMQRSGASASSVESGQAHLINVKEKNLRTIARFLELKRAATPR